MQTLYLIARKDLPDNTIGKMMAQVAHAQSDFDDWVSKMCPIEDDEIYSEIQKWKEDRSFGTTIVLHETLETMKTIVKNTMYSALTTDPTYPYRTFYGDVYTMEAVTSAWVFVSEDLTDFDFTVMKDFKLHP
jgi:peptidyl-tRNA hydrolase